MGYARFVHRMRFAILALWLLAGIGSLLLLPNLATVVAHQSTTLLPSSAPSMQAQHLLQQIDPGQRGKSSAIVAIARTGGLTAADRAFLTKGLRQLEDLRRADGVAYVQGAFSVPKAAQSSFTSRDGTTEIGVIGFPQPDTAAATGTALGKAKAAFAQPPQGLRVFFTGDVPIVQDTVQISQQGVSRTAAVTVALVLIILVLVLRSVAAPLLNLLTIGLSFVIASGIDAYLARFGLPVSTFTQTFLIAVMFGAGTDYAIILLGRFREELTHDHEDTVTAIAATLRGASRTVTFSGLTVLVSFATLFLAVFGLYRSGAGVAVGLVVTIAACLTLLPSLMAIFGRALFWPLPPRVGQAHRPSRIWRFTGTLATRHPWWTMLGLAAVLVPVALLFTNQRSFNTLAEIPQAPSVQGFQAVAGAFGEGTIMPLQIVLRSPSDLRSAKGLATLEAVSKALAAYPGVRAVDSATRPQGKVIAQFTLASQESLIAAQMTQLEKGLASLQRGLAAPGSTAAAGVSRLQSGAQQLSAQTPALATGLTAFAKGAQAVSGGAQQVGSAAGQLAAGAKSAAEGAQTLSLGAVNLASGAAQAATGAQGVAQGAASLDASTAQLASAAQGLSQALAAWAAANPGAAQGPSWRAIVSSAAQIEAGLSKASSGTQALAQSAQAESGALGTLSSGAEQVSTGAKTLAGGTQETAQGAGQLESAAQQFSQETAGLASAAPQLAKGTQAFARASGQLAQGLTTAASQGTPKGLAQAAQAAGALGSGTAQLQKALQESAAAGAAGDAGFGLPSGALKNQGLVQSMNAYISGNGHLAVFDVQLGFNPYSSQALAVVAPLEARAHAALAASPLPAGSLYAGGTPGQQADLSSISSSDFTHTIALVFLAIFILLAILLRSIISPIYILASLYATYFVAMGIVQEIFVHFLHRGGVEWSVSFFALLLLVALGVDYSIFLMTRFEEILRQGKPPQEAIREAMERMGGVIFSAVVIMAGTFGSMAFSGVTALVENGIAVVIGLFIYTGLLLGLFVPAATAIVGQGLRWPFRPRAVDAAARSAAD